MHPGNALGNHGDQFINPGNAHPHQHVLKSVKLKDVMSKRVMPIIVLMHGTINKSIKRPYLTMKSEHLNMLMFHKLINA